MSIQWSFFHHHSKSVITLGFQQTGDFLILSFHLQLLADILPQRKPFSVFPPPASFFKKKKTFYGLVFIIFNSMCLTHYPLFIGMLRFSPNLARGSSFLCPFDVISTDYFLAFWHKICLWILVFSLTQTCNKNTSSRSSVCFLQGMVFRNQDLGFNMCSLLQECYKELLSSFNRYRVYIYIIFHEFTLMLIFLIHI